ncbi:hypothetical protein KW797_00435 [Candidatus Parcubacteria bacterium]|nr:hypothetical protein [Candidatus Parcubacteria bacterium]
MTPSSTTTIELLTASAGDTLTAAFVKCGGASSKGIRVDCESQLQFFVDYVPDVSNATSATYAEWELIYTEQPADTADTSGGSATITWKSYVEEVTDPATAEPLKISSFWIKRWRAYANDTVNKDASPTFSVPFGVKRVNLQVKEVGMGSSFGTFTAKVGHQRI